MHAPERAAAVAAAVATPRKQACPWVGRTAEHQRTDAEAHVSDICAAAVTVCLGAAERLWLAQHEG